MGDILTDIEDTMRSVGTKDAPRLFFACSPDRALARPPAGHDLFVSKLAVVTFGGA